MGDQKEIKVFGNFLYSQNTITIMKTTLSMVKNVLFAVFLVTLLINAGCNSPPQQAALQTSTTQAAGQENAGQTVTTVAGAKTVTTVANTQATGNSGTGTDLNAQVKSLFQNGAKEYMVAYDTTMTGGAQNSYNGQMAYYVKADKLRMDTLAQTQGLGESRVYLSSNVYIVCNKQGAAWSCIKMPQQDTSQDPKKQADVIQKSIDTSVVSQLTDRVIVGVTAKCYKVTISATANGVPGGMPSGDYTYCISPDGVLLYSESNSGGMHVVQEATNYKTSVSDSDFVPPAEPIDLTAGMPGA